MRTLYSTCWVDPWLEVAKRLREKKNLIPIYWLGYYEDGSEELISTNFSDCKYHSRWNAWKGIFNNEVEDNFTSIKLNTDLLNNVLEDEIQAISMMDRMDPDRNSFPFAERQRLFRNLLRKWLYVINKEQIELVICDPLPHRSYDHALYVICKYLKIPFLFTYHEPPFPNRLLVLDDIKQLNYKIKQKYLDNKQNSIEELYYSLNKDIIETLDKVKSNYDVAVPSYMIDNKKRQKRNAYILKLAWNFLSEFITKKDYATINIRRNKGFLSDLLDVHPYSKRKNKSIEESKYNIIQYGANTRKAIKYKKSLKNLYSEISVKADLNKPYVYFAMHYQPEATTNPAAGIYVDHFHAVEVLLAQIPSDWKIYIKENPVQFDTVNEGQKSRIREYYLDLCKYEQVQFVPLTTSTFDLVDNAMLVSTLTGTVGWEAMVRKKPVVIFGLAWYEFYDGVLRIRNNDDANGIMQFINKFKYDEGNLYAYLNALQSNSTVAYSYMGINYLEQTQNETINNLVEIISSKI
jgi:hypothetical protein